MKKILIITISLFMLNLIGCSKDINEERLKQFVIEYDDALSKGWSESDEIFDPGVTQKYVSPDALLDHYSNKRWFIYSNDIEIISIEKIPEEEYEYFGKNSYQVIYKQNVLGKIENNTIIPFSISSDDDWRQSVCVALKKGKLYVTSYRYGSCWVKEKHLPTLIKRKGLVYSE